MGFFLVERYLSASVADASAVAADEDQRIGEELVASGVAGRHIRTIYVRDDETCFSVFEAPEARNVEEAFRRAGVKLDRITEALEVEPATRTTEVTG